MSGRVAPAHVAPVAILARDVLGAVAHRAVCQVPGCAVGKGGTPWSSQPVDALQDGSVAARVIQAAEAHAKRHTDAQDALDASVGGGTPEEARQGVTRQEFWKLGRERGYTDAQLEDAWEAGRRYQVAQDVLARVNQEETPRGTTDHRPQSGTGQHGEAHQ